ncbi:hypothetical protein LL06_21625 [Hoeflea sp. BAL378]|uniref:hypothetical protein n=1 Tax=Hoeflea sp. BAL378 TaxID=1547437 RepID=UPI0005131A7E|nr:hypothetical protein [Hoeflea sp. BAL378]KGF67547.1 hypothetical protein LL06_21625 [Hoeflea sp. BAL378]
MAKTATSTLLIGLAAWLLLAPAHAGTRPPAFAPAAEAAQPLPVSDRSRDRDWRMGDRGDRHDGRRDDRRRQWSGNDRHDGRTDWGRRGADGQQWGIRRTDRSDIYDRRDRDFRSDRNDHRGRDLHRRDRRPADTYSGGGGVWHDPGNGTYVYSGDGRAGGSGMRIIEVPTRRGPKVIGIAPGSFEGACDYSGDVCVIRPKR